MERRSDPLDDFTVINRQPTEKEIQMMSAFIRKNKVGKVKMTVGRKKTSASPKAKVA